MAPPKLPIKVVLKSSSSSSSNGSNSNASVINKSTENISKEDSEDELELEDEPEDFSESDVSETSTAQSSPRRMTARQRALQNKEQEHEVDIKVTNGNNKRGRKRSLTEEEMLLESEKVRKRKHLRDQKLEESKRATIERLLQKQSSRSKKTAKTPSDDASTSASEEQVQSILPLSSETKKYVSRRDAEFLMVSGEEVMGEKYKLPKRPSCCIKGCNNQKMYSSTSGKPLCSLACYKKLLNVK
jgi:INO80 complex subunit B